jgi:hypothetical protein
VCVCVGANGGGERIITGDLVGILLNRFLFNSSSATHTLLVYYIPSFQQKTKSSLKVTNLWWWLIQFIEGVDHPTTRRSSKKTSLRPPPDWQKQFSWHFDVHVSMLDGPRCLYQSSSNLTLWNTCCFETPFHFVFLFRIPTITFPHFLIF